MKTILMSVMAIAIVVGLVGVGTFAYFSDTETSTGNTFTAGTLDLAVGDPEDPGVFQNPWESVEIVVTDMKPSETHYAKETLKNVGNNPFKVWKMTTDITRGPGYPNTYPTPEASAAASSEPEYDEGGGASYVECSTTCTP